MISWHISHDVTKSLIRSNQWQLIYVYKQVIVLEIWKYFNFKVIFNKNP